MLVNCNLLFNISIVHVCRCYIHVHVYLYMYYKLFNINAIYTENKNITINMTNSMFSSPTNTVTFSSSSSPLDLGQYEPLIISSSYPYLDDEIRQSCALYRSCIACMIKIYEVFPSFLSAFSHR